MVFVYKHTVPNGKVYIGITECLPEERWKNGAGYRHNVYFTRAIKKYGWDNIKHEILFTVETREEAEQKEVEMIAFYKANDSKFGYNLTSGGEKGKKHSDISKKLMSEKLKGRPSKRKGRHCSKELKKRMSEAHKGIRVNIGVKFTEERKKHLSEAQKGKHKGSKNSQFGKKWTKEQLAIRQAHRVYATGGNCPNARPVFQFDLEGNFLKRWNTIKEATSVCCKQSIKDCLNKKYQQGGGFIWRYESEFSEAQKEKYINHLEKLIVNFIDKKKKKIFQFDLQGNFIKEYDSITEAALETNGSRNGIGGCLSHKYKTSGGFIWKLENEI